VSQTISAVSYVAAENQVLSVANGVDYAYRVTGPADATSLVMLQHFRGNLDNWDPALIDELARGRRVITFDNRGSRPQAGRHHAPLRRWRSTRSTSSKR
jgi:pimeloyl-ACP methyl ester carboxylesterase